MFNLKYTETSLLHCLKFHLSRLQGKLSSSRSRQVYAGPTVVQIASKLMLPKKGADNVFIME